MKKGTRILFVLSALFALLCVSALAEDVEPTQSGVYEVSTNSETTTLTLLPASGTGKAENVLTAAQQVRISETVSAAQFFPDVRRIKIECTGLEPGAQYMLFMLRDDVDVVPTEDNIVYIWQEAADAHGEIEFIAYPREMETASYSFYVTGGGTGFDLNAPLATIRYFRYQPPYLLGDPNEDGTIDSADALCALKYFVGKLDPTELQRLAADVNIDQVVDSEDALYMLKKFVGKIESFDEVRKAG